MPSLFEKACVAFDSFNSEDPNTIRVDGKTYPSELIYARRLSDWVDKLAPSASEPLRLAARCQHIGRWKIPRNQFPEGRSGYLKWRSTLSVFHADTAAQILRKAGYKEEIITRVKNINLKKNRETDPEVQTIEDALCLVFLQYQLEEFASKHDDEKLSGIIRKTWKKMSPAGHREALSLQYAPGTKAIIEKALI